MRAVVPALVFGLGIARGLPPFPSVCTAAQPCEVCHPQEVVGYSRSAMSHSLRRPAAEPEGSFVHSLSRVKFTMYSNQSGFWQAREADGEVSEYSVDYVIGSGNHASGYLVRIGDHLFQSPVCYYPRLKRYDMAPGYEENRAPDFTRPVGEECLLCHSGKPLPVPDTLNQYPSPAFAQESISCDRCHGDPAQHLKVPMPGTIVSPAKLAPAARNSICEQCHLKGVVRVSNPGQQLADFRPGEPLEQVFTIYTAAPPPGSPREGLKVISHAEQLALSLCARKSGGRLWCGTCHNPHDRLQHRAQYYRSRCLACHEGKLTKSHPGVSHGNCVACHMLKRNAKDGGHTVFTDHRISRSPEPEPEKTIPENGELVAWREPPAALRARNLALAYVTGGFENGSSSQVLRGYRMLTEMEKEIPSDPSVLTALGKALLAMNEPSQAVERFERVLRVGPDTAVNEQYAGMAWMQAGQTDKAAQHLERALELDPLLLQAAQTLVELYRRQGNMEKISALADRMRRALGSAAPRESAPPER